MARPLRTQITFPSVTGDPRLKTVSTFHWNCPDGVDNDDGAQSAIAQHIAFFNAAGPVGDSIAHLLSAQISRAANSAEVLAYDLSQPIPRSPIWGSFFTPFGPNVTTSMPKQLAVCLSYHADLTDIPEGQPGVPGQPRPRSRLRGRSYIGPVGTWRIANPADDEMRPDANFLAVLKNAAEDCRDRVFAGGLDVEWAVYSKITGLARPVVGGWVDNRFDVQRRRATVATARTDW